MADMALQMFVEEYWNAFKFIVDSKFSFVSPFSIAIGLQDLSFLFSHAKTHFFPEAFWSKVIDLAEPAAVRHFNTEIRASFVEFDFDLDDLAVIEFTKS